MMNLTVLTGRLAENPELRYTKGDEIPVTSFRLAVRRDYVRKDDTDTDFFDVVAWRSTAEFICKFFKKGSLIQLYGRLQNRSWQDKYEQNRVTAEIVADKVYFGDSKEGGAAAGNASSDEHTAGEKPNGLPRGFDPFAD